MKLLDNHNGDVPMSMDQLYSWRDAAMNAALRGYDNTEHVDALLEAVRANLRECSTLTMWPDHDLAVTFLRDECRGFRSLLSGNHWYKSYGTQKYAHYAAWFAVEWQGETIEVAIPPDYDSSTHDVVCIAPNDPILFGFADAMTRSMKRLPCRSLRYTQGWRQAPDIDAEIARFSWDDVVLPPTDITRLRSAVEGFANNKESYRRFGFAWRRGILLIGPPGTGKTMVCKAAAAALPQFPFLYVRDLRERNAEDAIEEIFRRARELAPCILAFEDLDGLIKEHNRSVFLNEMDGFTRNDGILVIASSNYPEKIDEALLRRPSRFDQVFHIGPPKKAERAEFCRRILTRHELAGHLSPDFDVEAVAIRIAGETHGFTPAFLKEAIVAAALRRAQDGASTLDSAYVDAMMDQIAELHAHLSRTKNPQALAEMEATDVKVGFRQ